MFPDFNLLSTPLMILVLQGLIFAGLLLARYQKERKIADLIIAIILLVMAYHRTTYTIGFMGWYDTFKNTKINYYLISLALAMGPLIYLYVRTTLQSPFQLRKKDLWHFFPVALFVLYRLIIWAHDIQQEDWGIGYEGEWHRDYHNQYLVPIFSILEYTSQLLYLAFTIQLFSQYKAKIRQYFSNTYRLELNWLRNFLALYIFLFVYGNITNMIDGFVVDLDYKHVWWVHLFSAIAIVYLGIKAYFTDISPLHTLTFDLEKETVRTSSNSPKQTFSKEKERIKAFLEKEQAYLNPDLTLRDLSENLGIGIHQLSEVINQGFDMNFNELINSYRVEEVKKRIIDPLYGHLSFIAIGFDSGFNSKATFNRVFKQQTGLSPSQFKQQKEGEIA